MAKGAVQIGGSYRLIDIPLSNCIASGIYKMYVFTQYNSSLLNNYIAHTYDFGFSFGKRGFVEVRGCPCRAIHCLASATSLSGT